jgi:hypothetical protein
MIRRIGDKNEARNISGFVIPSPYFEVAVAADGLLRVNNPGTHRIEAFTAKGDLEFGWGQFGNEIDGFTGCCNPISFAIMPDGRFVTCEKGLVRVKVYDADGTFSSVVAGPQQLADGACLICESPDQCQDGGFDVAVDKDNRVYVLDTVKNEIRVFVEKGS